MGVCFFNGASGPDQRFPSLAKYWATWWRGVRYNQLVLDFGQSVPLSSLIGKTQWRQHYSTHDHRGHEVVALRKTRLREKAMRKPVRKFFGPACSVYRGGKPTCISQVELPKGKSR
jgi:hypothetical protein